MKIAMTMSLVVTLLAPFASHADALSEDRVKELVLEAIRENPEIVLEAVQIIERREQERQAAAAASVLSENRDFLENDPNAPVLGNPEGDVTVVEFFDYNCPYCRRVKPHIEALLDEDPNVRLHATAVGAVVVEEFDDRYITFGVAEEIGRAHV